MKRLAAIGSIVFIGCAGCGSGISITHVSSSASTLTGVPWNLSMTQYKLTITRQISECDGTLKGTVTVDVVPEKVPDSKQNYLLDSTGWWATSDITSTMSADGSSAGLNATSQDATAQVISSVVSLVAETAIVAGAGAVVPGKPTFTCSDKVKIALTDMKPADGPTLQNVVTTETKTLSAATDKVTLLTSQSQKDPTYKKPLAKALGEQAKAQSALNQDQARLTKDRKDLTDTQTIAWPLQADQFRADNAYHLSPATLSKWIKPVGLEPGMSPPKPPETSMFDVSLALYIATDEGGWVTPPTTAIGDVSVGIPVRAAKVGRLLVCTGAEKCPPSLASDWIPTPSQSAPKDQPVLQLGQVYNVRVRGGVFKSEGAVIALDSNGLPTSIEVSEKAAAAAVAAGAASSAATTVAGIPNAIAASELARAQAQSAQIAAQTSEITYKANLSTAADTAAAQAQTALDNAKTALASAQANAQNAGPAAALTAQTSLLNAQNALAALDAGAPYTAQQDALTAQTALYNAQASQINAEVAKTKAQAALP